MAKEDMVDAHTHTHTHTHTLEYYSAIKKNEILPFATTWMDMEGIMLSENKSDRERQVQYDFTFMCNLKDETNEQTKQKRM